VTTLNKTYPSRPESHETRHAKASKVIQTQAYKQLLLITFEQVISQVELISKNRLATYAKHAKVTQVIIESTICHDYKVVNIIQNLNTPIMLFLLPCLDSTGTPHPYPKVSQRFESIYTLQGK
jgi:hypothetical protein